MKDHKEFTSPILAVIFNIGGVLCIVGAGIAGVIILRGDLRAETLGFVVALLILAVYNFGIAEVISYLGRTAYSTNRLCDLIDDRLDRRLYAIESRLNSKEPILVRSDSAPN